MGKKLYEENNIQAVANAIRQKNGGSTKYKVSEMPSAILAIETGSDVSGVTATADKVLTGYAFVDSTGAKKNGSMPNNGAISETMDGIDKKSVSIPKGYTEGGTVSLTDDIENIADEQTDLISQIQTALEGKAAGGGGGVTPSGTIEITENGTHDVTNYASALVNVASSGGGNITIETLSDITLACNSGSWTFTGIPVEGLVCFYCYYNGVNQVVTTADSTAPNALPSVFVNVTNKSIAFTWGTYFSMFGGYIINTQNTATNASATVNMLAMNDAVVVSYPSLPAYTPLGKYNAIAIYES